MGRGWVPAFARTTVGAGVTRSALAGIGKTATRLWWAQHQGQGIWDSSQFVNLAGVTLFAYGLGITLLVNGETWLQILVAVVAMGTSFLAGVFSTGLGIAALLPIVVLASLVAAFSLFGVPSSDVEPIAFAVLLSLIYGGVAYLPLVRDG